MRLARGCNRCGLQQRIVWGVGPAPARVMLIGEAPGENESRAGVPFVGKSGKELDYLLARAGIQRGDVYVTNLVKCRPPKNRDPSPEETEACAGWLSEELAQVRPRFIIAVGRIAARWFLGDVSMDAVHGLPFKVADRIVLPVFHPAFGLHVPKKMLMVQADFEAVGEIVAGKRPITPPVDEFAGKEDYGELHD